MRDAKRFHPAPRRTVAGFLNQESGSVTIFSILGFALCMVIIGFTFDLGRVMGIHTQVSSYADSVALSAARELDGRPGALTRARDAGRETTSVIGAGDRLSISSGDRTIGVQRLTFLSRLAPLPNDPTTRSPVAGDVVTAIWNRGSNAIALQNGFSLADAERETQFVLVDTTREREEFILLPLLAWMTPGLGESITVAPQAIAGFDRQICNSPPLMLCNPAEASAPGANFTFDPGDQIRANIRPSGGALRPGDMKLLSTPQGPSVARIREYMGRIVPNTFCTGRTIDVRNNTNPSAIREGLNTRLDMFSAALVGQRNSGDYTPAPVAPKGFDTTPGSCAVQKSTINAPPTTPLPRDNCFMPSGTWPDGIPAGSGSGCTTFLGTRLAGDGNWARTQYWTTNHPGVSQPAGYATMSRYQVYRAEIAGNIGTSENRCSTSPNTRVVDPLRDRRVFPIAIVNCLTTPVSGDRDDVPVEAYAEVFLTEPVGNQTWWNGDDEDVFLEIIGVTRRGLPETVQREFPVLFR
jgi:hypothetical protein